MILLANVDVTEIEEKSVGDAIYKQIALPSERYNAI